MKPVRLHYVPSCAFSAAAVSFLVSRGADFATTNLDEHPGERARLEEQLAGKRLETPAYEVEGRLHVAPPLSELKKLLEEWGLPASAAPHQKLKEG